MLTDSEPSLRPRQREWTHYVYTDRRSFYTKKHSNLVWRFVFEPPTDSWQYIDVRLSFNRNLYGHLNIDQASSFPMAYHGLPAAISQFSELRNILNTAFQQ